MDALRDSSQGLACMNISTGGNPDCLQTGVGHHFIVVAIDIDTKFLVLLVVFGPLNFVVISAAHSHNLGSWDPIQQGVDVSLALSRILETSLQRR